MSLPCQTRLPRANPSCVASIRRRIQQLPPKAEVEPATLSMYQIVQQLYDDILAFKALGYDAAFICQLLQDESGLPFQPSTLATYLSLEKRRRGGSRKRSRSGSGRSRGSAPGKSSPGRSKPGNAEPGLAGPGNADPKRSKPGNTDPTRSSPGRSAPERPGTESLFSGSAVSEGEAQEIRDTDASMAETVVVHEQGNSLVTESAPGAEGKANHVSAEGDDPLAYAMRRVDFSFLNSCSQPSTGDALNAQATVQQEPVVPV